MTRSSVRWLLDAGLPHVRQASVDALNVEDFPRVPGPSGIQEAGALDRTLVTCNQEFRGSWRSPIGHPGIVIMEDCPSEGPEVERNLLHCEFRLWQYGGTVTLAGNRFVLKADRELMQILPDGTETALAPWRQVRIDHPVGVPAFSGA